MPNIDDHMDELFQNAAENYPLRTRPGNFDDLLPFVAVEITAKTVPPAALAKGKRKTALLLLVFLVTGGIIATYIIHANNNKPTAARVLNEKINNEIPRTGISDQQNNMRPTNENRTAETEKRSAESATIFQKNKLATSAKAKIFTQIIPAAAVSDMENEEKKQDTYKEPVFTDTDRGQSIAVTTKTETKNETAANNGLKKESPAQELKSVAVNDKKQKRRPLLYFGVIAGTEFNQVKNQGMTKVGFNGGIVAGLQVNKKVSVETGVLLSQKKYYTSGKHFTPKSGEMPSNMTVNSLDGTSTLIEIPVSIKYDLSKKKNGIYAKAGASSYIMTNERNKYQAMVSGQQREINSTYHNTKTYLAADIRISAGYQYVLSKKIKVRIEPYILIPLKGIGIGALPVTSTGLQLVLTSN